jgi:hypothetical protein
VVTDGAVGRSADLAVAGRVASEAADGRLMHPIASVGEIEASAETHTATRTAFSAGWLKRGADRYAITPEGTSMEALQ